MRIEMISWVEARRILNENTNRLIKLEPMCTFYGVFVNNKIVSMAGVHQLKNCIRIKNCYTPIKHRKRGYFTALLERIKNMHDIALSAYCTESSKDIFVKSGFELLYTYERGDQLIYYVRRDYEKD